MLEEPESGNAPTGEKGSDQGGISVATFFGIGFSILVTLIFVVSILALSTSHGRAALRSRLHYASATGRESPYLEGTRGSSIDIPRPPTARTNAGNSTRQIIHDLRYQQHASFRAAGDVRPALFRIGDFHVSSIPRVSASRPRDIRRSEAQATYVRDSDVTRQTNGPAPNTTEGSIHAVNPGPRRPTPPSPRAETSSPHEASQSSNPRGQGSSEASEDGSTSGRSFSVSDSSLVGTAVGIYKEQAVESLMTEFRTLLTHGAHIGLKVRAGGRSGEQSIGDKEEASSSSSFHRARITKRARNDEAYTLKNGGHDMVNGMQRNRTANIPTPVSRFACPYYKRNPKKHLRHRSCAGPGWGEVRRVKEHLYRTHALPIHCNRCGIIMKTEADLRAHQRLPQGCVVRPVDLPEGFNKIQETELRKKKQGETEEQKWYAMYKILFPDEDGDLVPSPYYRNRDTGDAEQQRVDDINEYERFQRRELLRVVRRRLQDTVSGMTGPLEDQLRREFVEIIRQAQAEVFQAYRATWNPGRDSRSVQPTSAESAIPPSYQISLTGSPEGQTVLRTSNTPSGEIRSHTAGQWTAERITPPIDADLERISPAADMMDCGNLYLNPEGFPPLFDIGTVSMAYSPGDYYNQYGDRVPSSAVQPPCRAGEVDQISSMGSYLTSGYNTTSESHEASVRSITSLDMGRDMDEQTIHSLGGAGGGGCAGWHSPHLGSLMRLDQ